MIKINTHKYTFIRQIIEISDFFVNYVYTYFLRIKFVI